MDLTLAHPPIFCSDTCEYVSPLSQLRNNPAVADPPRHLSPLRTLEEEKVFDFQDKRGLLTLGWVCPHPLASIASKRKLTTSVFDLTSFIWGKQIHTHPTQSCFMSSLDVRPPAPLSQ
jgi:hypothetical protein